jgi:hypothetical protein
MMCRQFVAQRIEALTAELRRARILLAWSNGTLKLHEAAALLGVGPGELWAMERAEMAKLQPAEATI